MTTNTTQEKIDTALLYLSMKQRREGRGGIDLPKIKPCPSMYHGLTIKSFKQEAQLGEMSPRVASRILTVAMEARKKVIERKEPGSFVTCPVPLSHRRENGLTVIGRIVKENPVSYTVDYSLRDGNRTINIRKNVLKFHVERAEYVRSTNVA